MLGLYVSISSITLPFMLQAKEGTPLADTISVPTPFGTAQFGSSYIAPKVQINVDYAIYKGGFDGTVVESSSDKGRIPLRFTVGTGAVNPAVDEAVRTMIPGEVRRVVVPAKFDLDKSGSKEPLYLQLRLRTIKGPSSFNVCAAPPVTTKIPASVICEPGAMGTVP